IGPAAALFLGLWLGLRQSGWLLLFGVVWVISGWIIFVFHALLPSVLRNWLRRTDRNGNRRFVPIADLRTATKEGHYSIASDRRALARANCDTHTPQNGASPAMVMRCIRRRLPG